MVTFPVTSQLTRNVSLQYVGRVKLGDLTLPFSLLPQIDHRPVRIRITSFACGISKFHGLSAERADCVSAVVACFAALLQLGDMPGCITPRRAVLSKMLRICVNDDLNSLSRHFPCERAMSNSKSHGYSLPAAKAR